MGSSRFYSALAALLFAAVCAWMGAAVFAALPPPGELSAAFAQDTSSIALYGIVLRREEALSPKSTEGYSPGTVCRIPAGNVISSDGSTSAESALFCPESDGLEYLSPDSIGELGPDVLDSLMASQPKETQGPKLIYGFDFYYAAFLEGAADIKPGPCRVCFEGSEEVYEGSLLSVSQKDGRCALLFRFRMRGDDFAALRICRAKLIL